jgi:hypothetical protein
MTDLFQSRAGQVAVFRLPDSESLAYFDLLDKGGQALSTNCFVMTTPEIRETASYTMDAALNGRAYLQTFARFPGEATLSGYVFASDPANCRGTGRHQGFIEFLQFYDRHNVAANPGRPPEFIQLRTGSSRLRLFITSYQLAYDAQDCKFQFTLSALTRRA